MRARARGGAGAPGTERSLLPRLSPVPPPSRTRHLSQVLEAVKTGDYSVGSANLSKAFAIIDKNVKRGIVHKNTAARKKSRLSKIVKTIEG